MKKVITIILLAIILASCSNTEKYIEENPIDNDSNSNFIDEDTTNIDENVIVPQITLPPPTEEPPIFETISFEEGENIVNINLTKDAVGGFVDYILTTEGVTHGESAADVRFSDGEWATISLVAQNGATWDLSTDEYVLAYDITNPLNEHQRIMTSFNSSTGNITYMNEIPANNSFTMYCVMNEKTRNLGVDHMPTPVQGENGLIVGTGWGGDGFDRSKITTIGVRGASLSGGAAYFILDNFRIVENPVRDTSITYNEIVDEYGQFIYKDFENKITKDEDLTDNATKERVYLDGLLKDMDARTDRTIYGGWKNDDYKQEATGYFYTTKIGNHWTLIDPLGYPYFATGLDIVRKNGMDTKVFGREYLFKDIPKTVGPLMEHYFTSGNFSFYSANLERKYGDDWYQTWADTSIDRFKGWGFTSLGAWSEPELFYNTGDKYKMPYVAFAWSHQGSTHKMLNNSAPDPFDPSFFTSVKNAINTQVNKYDVQNDPYCFGIYVDNEIVWGNDAKSSPLVKSVLAQDGSISTSYAKIHFIEVLKEKYGTIDELNKAWASKFESFDDLNKSYTGFVAEKDCSLILYGIADKYFEVVAKAVDETMPNTLYLGARNTEFGTPREITQGAANHVDILSFNCYKSDPIQEKFCFEEYDLPMIIGEFDFQTAESGLAGQLKTHDERKEAYINYTQAALKSGKYVGVHWFQYYDEPVMGRSFDGENSNTGFVDVADTPYQNLVDATLYLHDTMYETKFNYDPITRVQLKENSADLLVGETTKLEFIYPEEEFNFNDYKIKSDNLHIATISEDGTITAVSQGSTVITIKSKYNIFATTSFIVNVAEPDLKISPIIFKDEKKVVDVSVNETVDILDYLKDKSGLSNTDMFVSSNNAIATVDKDGILTANSVGTVNVFVQNPKTLAMDSIQVNVK